MTPFAKFIGFALVASAAYYAVAAKVPQQARPSNSSPVAGWDDLQACPPMRSLDGRKTLSFAKGRTFELRGGVAGQKAQGVWAFDEAGKRYLLTSGSGQSSYVLVRPENSEVCILARGELTSSDMSESWYSRTLSDMQGDLTDADR